jgi:hypothetical protein
MVIFSINTISYHYMSIDTLYLPSDKIINLITPEYCWVERYNGIFICALVDYFLFLSY